MSIAIASALSKPAAPANSTDTISAETSPAAGADFANLLLAQLAAGVELLGDGAPGNTNATDASEIIAADQAAPQDAALLFAALGIAPPAPLASNGHQALAKEDRGTASELSASPLKGDGTTLSLAESDADGRTKTDLPGLGNAGDDGKPAKFAVTDLLAEKNIALNGAAEGETRASGVLTHAPTQQPTSGPQNNAPLKIETPVHDRQAWTGDFGQKIVWLATNDKQSAQLTLNPPQMGPIEISLNITRDSANALFVSANPEVREAIESAMPRLREMLAGAGIELGQANVSAESPRQQAGGNNGRAQGESPWKADNAILGADSGAATSHLPGIAQRGNGLVDLFA